MASSWIRRLHPQDELQASKRTVFEHVKTTGEFQETDMVGKRTPKPQHFEGKTDNSRAKAKGDSFLDTKNADTCGNDPQQVRKLSVDLQKEKSVNANLTHRIDLTYPHGTVKDDLKMESRGVVIKPFSSAKTLISLSQNKNEVLVNPVCGQVLFSGVVKDAVEQTVHSNSKSIVLDAPSATEIVTSEDERNKIGCNSTLSVMADNNIYSDDCSMHVHERTEEENGEKCIKDYQGIKSGNLSFPFTCEDLQLTLSPPRQCSVAKIINMDFSKDVIKLGGPHKPRLSDTFCSSSLSWSTFADAAGPSKSTRCTYEQEIQNERMSQVVNTGVDRGMGNSSRFVLTTTKDVLYDPATANQYSQQDDFKVETKSKMAEAILRQRVSYNHQYSATRRMHCIDLTEGNCQNVPLARDHCRLHETVPPDKLIMASSDVNDTMAAVEHKDGSNLGDMDGNNLCQTHDALISDALSQIQNECEGHGFSNDSGIHKWLRKEKLQGNPSSSRPSQVTGFHDNSSRMQSSLGKRPSMIFENRTVKTKTNNKSNMWIQRWHTNTSCNIKNIHGDRLLENSTTSNVNKFKDTDYCNTKDGKGNVSVPDQSLESSKLVTSKMFPSVAAMAIVGTATRRFCSTQPQQKGFAFWTGFGMPETQNSSGGKSKPML